jgi:hypothetical protein
MRDVSTPCPLCGAAMEQCDYSPLYGYSWIHPKSETTAICEYSGKLVFSGNYPIQGGTMTDTQLKPCPFCGAAGVKSRQGYYTCSNDHCNLVTMSDGWNYRPIEDALQARIEELELILAADKLIEDGWIGRIEAGDKRIAELEAENAKLKPCPIGSQESKPPDFKVGDWVEYSDGTLQQAIIEAYSGQPGEQMVYVWHPQTAHSAKTPLQFITRKLDPSEVKVKVTLAGTVESRASATSFFHLRYGDGVMDWASIDLRHLNPDDRKLVESLLKAQEEK